MTRVEMENTLKDFTDEYSRAGKYEYLRDKDGYCPPITKEELAEYRQRLKAFFKNNDTPRDLDFAYKIFSIAESFSMSYGFDILSDDDTPNEAYIKMLNGKPHPLTGRTY